MKKLVIVMSAMLMLMRVGMAGAQAAPSGGPAAARPTVQKQTVCPVMGGEVNRDLFADFDGKRVYFCCKGCPAVFKQDPAKYIAKLEKDGW
ncbi:MAG: hypothetical protein NTV49_13655 [Kiritimatiellaeota bacterium]|nr:hypothetical protein [Kiritimatiellota bacterium]